MIGCVFFKEDPVIQLILAFALIIQIALSPAFAERTVSSENFNTLVNDVTADQMTTAHLF